MSDLAPCPFCSSSDMLVIEDDGIHVNPKIIAVHCKSCGARGPTTGRRIDVESKIITRSRWNRHSLATQHHQGADDLAQRILGVLDDFASMQPEEDEDWESWYRVAFDLARDKVSKLLPALAQQPLSVQEGWRPIAEADNGIAHIIDAAGLHIGNSVPIWARDIDGRVFECLWADDGKRAYWWDIEGESPVDPVEFMPHPLAPRAASEGSTNE